ncbi:hypothetical protein GKE82_25620 [Conexibacter sp. W3-3-2]|uniref:hypothetical protein n=1 Tax=Conexibacter sp. W3-3-2 TaxID=2675227 RepID=UPI0012B9788F|nr:hypothetical protein [Conexibacter sp. W3-3-2]MTD47447.1 hypothetical protein [Conexibacter sp. W3-3-2]MTD47586.1 hypothetical protein [Conexibacter sp. W3-3-2]
MPNETADRLSELARAAGVSMTALAVAVLERHLPLETGKVRELVLATARPRRGSAAIQTTEMNLRLPTQLRVRMDELISALPAGAKIKRAHLISGVLDAHLAADADAAYRQVTEYESRSMRHELAA